MNRDEITNPHDRAFFRLDNPLTPKCQSHCYHAPSEVAGSSSLYPTAVMGERCCCHCGVGEWAAHGPYHPGNMRIAQMKKEVEEFKALVKCKVCGGPHWGIECPLMPTNG